MAERSVTVRLRADISSYTRGMRTAARSSSELAGIGAAASTALVAGFAMAVAAAAKFDKALSNVRAVSGASAAQMTKLRAAALEAGKSTSFSATEAADAEAELARAGVSVANITGGALKGSLALAASGQIDLSESATIAAQAMNTFGLAGKDVGHIADVLSAGANKSASDVHGLGESLRMGGLLAHQTGLSLEDTVGTLSAFADHALIGSDAGTSLKTMLQRLVPQSQEAKAAMDKLGFSAYDSQGNFVGLSELAGRLQTSFGKLTPEARNSAMATIFGSDAVRAATILYEQGSAGIDKYVKAVDDQGAAQRMASIQTDNLAGDFERLRGALEVALIEGGSSANGALRDMTQWITKLITAYGNLPPGLQHAVTLFSGIAGAAGLAAAGVLMLLPRIASTRAALASMGVTAARTRASLASLGKLSGVIAGLTLLSYAAGELRDVMKGAGPTANELTASLVDFAQQGAASGALVKRYGADLGGLTDAIDTLSSSSANNGAVQFLDKLSTGFGLFGDGEIDSAKTQLTGFDQALADLVTSGNADTAAKAFDQLAGVEAKHGKTVEQVKALMPQYADALAGVETQAKLTAGGQTSLGDATTITADAMKDTRSEAEKLTDALKALNGGNISAGEAEIAFQGSLDDLTAAVDKNGHSLDVRTQKGRDNKSAFLDAAKAAMTHAEAIAEQTNSVDAGNKVLGEDITALKKSMLQAGYSKDAVDKLTSAYLQLPSTAGTVIEADTSDAMSGLESVKRQLAGIPAGKTVNVGALTGAAIKALRDLGFKVQTLPNGTVRVTVPTKGPDAAITALQKAIDDLHGKRIDIAVVYTKYNDPTTGTTKGHYADGGVVHAADGLFVPGYAPRQDTVPAMLSPGEGVLVPEAVRRLGGERAITALNRWGRYGVSRHAVDSGQRSLLPAHGTRQMAGGGRPMVLEIRSGGSRMDDLLVEMLQKSVRVRGGNVQTVLGRA